MTKKLDATTVATRGTQSSGKAASAVRQPAKRVAKEVVIPAAQPASRRAGTQVTTPAPAARAAGEEGESRGRDNSRGSRTVDVVQTAMKGAGKRIGKTSPAQPAAADAASSASSVSRESPASVEKTGGTPVVAGGETAEIRVTATNGAGGEVAIADITVKTRKPKLVRDSFTMPEDEYALLSEIKKKCLKAGYEVKKSELLRVGVALVGTLNIVALKDVLAALPPLKAGRPKKS